RIGIPDEAALRAAWTGIEASVARTRPKLALDGMLVEAMARPGLEMMVGAQRDPHWGPVLMVGLGGVFIEALRDVRLLPADVTPAEVEAELARLRSARLLGPFRGRPARDVGALARAVALVGALMRANPGVAEIDINPLLVHASG